jgi:GT2 family glycosyltransferase
MRRLLAPAGDAPIEPGPIPSFSIVIPAYQAAGFIADSVESALEQTLEPREVIVCDDGSTDYLGSALAPFRERITLLRQAHRGAGAARNAAVRVASGEFVVMLDADDVYEPERLSALAELAAARPDLDILGTDLSYEVAGAPDGRFYQFTEFPLQHQRLAILESCFVACPALRRARVLEVGGFDESLAIAQDWDLFVRLILGGCKAGIVDEPLLRYRKHPHSATANRSRALWARVEVLEKTRRHPGLTAEERRFLDRCLVRARARSALTDAKVVTSSRPPGLRRSLLALAATKNIPPTTRLTLGAAALAPVAARSVLDWKERRVAGIRPRRPRPIS